MSRKPIPEQGFEPQRRKRRAPLPQKVETPVLTYEELLDKHLRDCRMRNLSSITIDGYRFASRYFLDFAGTDLLCEDIDQDLINDYVLYLQEHYKPQTVNSYHFKVSATIRFGIEQGYIRHNIQFTHLVEQETIKEIYTEEELKILLKRPESGSFTDVRAWTIISTFLATGIRASELRALLIQDVHLEAGYITLNKTKNNEPRVVPIPSTLHEVLADWLRIRHAEGEAALFCNIYGEPLARTVLQNIVKRYSQKRGIERYGLHLYRHTFITLSIRKGMSPVLLKRITGHKTTKMLEHYYAFNPMDLVNVVDEYNPLEDFKPKRRVYR